MSYVITEACVDIMDRSCVEQCPVDCIAEGDRMLYIDPEACIDCGACEPACPQEAIHMDMSLPAELGHYGTINAEFFADDSYGPAARDSGRPVGVDPPGVRDLPRRTV